MYAAAGRARTQRKHRIKISLEMCLDRRGIWIEKQWQKKKSVFGHSKYNYFTAKNKTPHQMGKSAQMVWCFFVGGSHKIRAFFSVAPWLRDALPGDKRWRDHDFVGRCTQFRRHVPRRSMLPNQAHGSTAHFLCLNMDGG